MVEKDLLATRNTQVDVMKTKVAEQGSTYDKMNGKMFALLSLEIAVAGLFSYDVFQISTPNNILEWMLFVGAISCMGLSALAIFINYQAKKEWASPMGPLEVEKMNNATNLLSSLTILYDDYRDTFSNRQTTLGKKALFLNLSLYLFVASVILLIVLKIGG